MIGETRQVDPLRNGRLFADGSTFDQECGPTFQFAAQQIHALLGLGPVLHHDILEFIVEEFFRSALPCGIDLDEIRQYAFRPELSGAPGFKSGQQLLR